MPTKSAKVTTGIIDGLFSAVSSGDNAEVTHAHIEKTVMHASAKSAMGPLVPISGVLPSDRLARFTTSRRLWRRGASGSPTIPRTRADAERIGEEPWHELRSRIVLRG